MRRHGITAVIVLALMASAAFAESRIRRGDQELSLHISPDFEGAVGDMIFADAGYAYFVRDRLALRGTLGYTVLEDVAGEDSDYRMREIDVAAEYHFELGNAFVPYVGAGLGWARSEFHDRAESAVVYGPRAGLKLFLADNVALDFEIVYRLGSADVFINDFEREDSDLSTAIGFRVFF